MTIMLLEMVKGESEDVAGFVWLVYLDFPTNFIFIAIVIGNVDNILCFILNVLCFCANPKKKWVSVVYLLL